jgi:hypothetical protein
MGISFQVDHHLFGDCGTAPKYCKFDSSPTEQGCLSTDLFLCLSSIPFVAAMGAVTSKVVWWVASLKRDPHTPFSVLKKENLKLKLLWPLCKNNYLYE